MAVERNPLLGPEGQSLLPSGPPTKEIGTVTQTFAGIGGWGAFLEEMEQTPELTWPASIWTYHRMRTDSQIDALHLGTVAPIKEFRWSVDPNKAKPDLVERIASDFGLPVRGHEDEPVKRSSRKFSFDQFLADALLAPLYGRFDFEAVGEVVEGKEWHLTKAAPRHPRTIMDFKTDEHGTLEAIRQNIVRIRNGRPGLPPPIPAAYLIPFVWRPESGSLVGRSMLRSMFREWAVKDRTMRIAVINLARAGGVPVIEGPPGASDEQIKDLAELARQFKVAEGGGGAIPFGTKLNLVGGDVPSAIELLKYCDECMARVWTLMLLQLGTTQTGNRALGQTFASYAARAQAAIAKWFEDSINVFFDRYVEWNEPLADYAPLLHHEQAKSDSASVEEMKQLTESGLLTVDQELEEWIRSERGLPERPEGTPYVQPTPQASPSPPGGEPSPAPDGVPASGSAPSRAQAKTGALSIERLHRGIRASLTLPDRELRRTPSENEVRAAVDFRALDVHHSDVVNKLQDAWLRDILPHQIGQMADQVRYGAGGVPRKRFTKGMAAKLEAPLIGRGLMERHLVEAAGHGAALAHREAQAQGVRGVALPAEGEHLARVADQAAAVERLNANAVALAAQRHAAQMVGGGKTPQQIAQQLEDRLKGMKHVWERQQLRGAVTFAQNQGRIAQFALAKAALTDPVQAEAAALLSRHAAGAEVAADELDRATKLAIQPALDAAGAAELLRERANYPEHTIERAEGVYNAAQRQSEPVYEASELLDNATCGPCEAIDGTVFESLDEAEAAYAGGGYVECEGGPNCRGTLVAIYPEQNPEAGEELGPLREPEELYVQPSRETGGEPPEGGPMTPGLPPIPPPEAIVLGPEDELAIQQQMSRLAEAQQQGIPPQNIIDRVRERLAKAEAEGNVERADRMRRLIAVNEEAARRLAEAEGSRELRQAIENLAEAPANRGQELIDKAQRRLDMGGPRADFWQKQLRLLEEAVAKLPEYLVEKEAKKLAEVQALVEPARVAPERFVPFFRKAFEASDHKAWLTMHEPDYYAKAFLAHGGKVGGGLHVAEGEFAADGRQIVEAVSLFNQGGPPGAGVEMLDKLVANGANRLEAMGEHLRGYYERHGFVVARTIKWDDRYAPEGWNYDLDKRPNIYVMDARPDYSQALTEPTGLRHLPGMPGEPGPGAPGAVPGVVSGPRAGVGAPKDSGPMFSTQKEASYEDALTHGEIHGESGNPSEGVSVSYMARVGEDKILEKPEAGASGGRGTGAAHETVLHERYSERERAVYLVGQRMGIPVPTTVMRHGGPNARGETVSVMRIVPHAVGEMANVAPREWDAKDVHDLALLDYVTANLDRHAGNAMLVKLTPEELAKGDRLAMNGEPSKFRLVPIDHNISFPDEVGSEWANAQFIGRVGGDAITDEDVAKLNNVLAHRDELITDAKLSEDQVGLMEGRIDELLKTREFPSWETRTERVIDLPGPLDKRLPVAAAPVESNILERDIPRFESKPETIPGQSALKPPQHVIDAEREAAERAAADKARNELLVQKRQNLAEYPKAQDAETWAKEIAHLEGHGDPEYAKARAVLDKAAAESRHPERQGQKLGVSTQQALRHADVVVQQGPMQRSEAQVILDSAGQHSEAERRRAESVLDYHARPPGEQMLIKPVQEFAERTPDTPAEHRSEWEAERARLQRQVDEARNEVARVENLRGENPALEQRVLREAEKARDKWEVRLEHHLAEAPADQIQHFAHDVTMDVGNARAILERPEVWDAASLQRARLVLDDAGLPYPFPRSTPPEPHSFVDWRKPMTVSDAEAVLRGEGGTYPRLAIERAQRMVDEVGAGPASESAFRAADEFRLRKEVEDAQARLEQARRLNAPAEDVARYRQEQAAAELALNQHLYPAEPPVPEVPTKVRQAEAEAHRWEELAREAEAAGQGQAQQHAEERAEGAWRKRAAESAIAKGEPVPQYRLVEREALRAAQAAGKPEWGAMLRRAQQGDVAGLERLAAGYRQRLAAAEVEEPFTHRDRLDALSRASDAERKRREEREGRR